MSLEFDSGSNDQTARVFEFFSYTSFRVFSYTSFLVYEFSRIRVFSYTSFEFSRIRESSSNSVRLVFLGELVDRDSRAGSPRLRFGRERVVVISYKGQRHTAASAERHIVLSHEELVAHADVLYANFLIREVRLPEVHAVHRQKATFHFRPEAEKWEL